MTRNNQIVLASSFVAALAVAAPACADDASPWIQDMHSAMRLLAGSRNGAMMLGGIALQISPGWKTYWRYPGDSGVPPRFDFSRSDNVESVTVLWPAPTIFSDGAGGHSLGYHGEIILPLKIVAKNANKPAVLHADVSYAVCEKLCLPVEAKAEVSLDNVASMQDSALAAALDTVPKPALIGAANPLTIRSVSRDHDKVIVDVTAPSGSDVHLYAEGPSADWALPIPTRIEPAPAGLYRFGFALDGAPSGADLKNVALKLTLTSADRAYEFDAKIE